MNLVYQAFKIYIFADKQIKKYEKPRCITCLPCFCFK